MASKAIIGLDVGEKRIGVALARAGSSLPQPLVTLERNEGSIGVVQELIREHDIGNIVVGLPRGLDGQETQQTQKTRAFSDELAAATSLPIRLQDEAGTSLKAEEELRARGKPFAKGDVDALAAVFILSDYLEAR